MHETQATIGEWAVATFGGESGLTPRHCIRLLEEVLELCYAAGATAMEINGAVIKAGWEAAGKDHEAWDRLHYHPAPKPEKVPEELADCAIVLDTLAHRADVDLRQAVDAKMQVNRGRSWDCRGDGTGYHTG